MIQKLSELVSVSLTFDSEKRAIRPRAIIWKGRLHAVKKVGLHHKFKKGSTLFHVFSVVSNNMFFRLVLNTDNLHWKLEEISDGLPN